MLSAIEVPWFLARYLLPARYSRVLLSSALRIQRIRHPARRSPPDQRGDPVGGGNELCHVDTGFDPHTFQHVDDVFGGDIAGGTGRKRAATEAARGGID